MQTKRAVAALTAIAVIVIVLIAFAVGYVLIISQSTTTTSTTSTTSTCPEIDQLLNQCTTSSHSTCNALAIVCTTSSTTQTGTTLSAGQDYNLWVKPYLSNLAKIEAVLTAPYQPGQQQSYGYYANLGLTCGANIEPSPAININNGYNNACVLADNNIEGSASLDYFASSQSVLTGQSGWQQMNLQIYTNTRNYMKLTFYGIGPCTSPFQTYTYPASFAGYYDRREPEYGFAGPYATQLIQPGIHIGGIGSLNCNGSSDDGQIWYAQNYDSSGCSSVCIVTEFPSEQAPGTSSDLEELSFVIDELYMQCIAGTVSCSQWQSAYMNAMSQYPFQAPREALHFIQVSRATAAWTLTNMSYNGMSPSQMMSATITKLFTSTASGGATGSDGGLTQSWGSGGSNTPEPNDQAMIAFDPRMPSWFTLTCMNNPSSCQLV